MKPRMEAKLWMVVFMAVTTAAIIAYFVMRATG